MQSRTRQTPSLTLEVTIQQRRQGWKRMPAVNVVMSRVHAGPPNEPGQWGNLAEEARPCGGLKVQRSQPSRLDSGPGRGQNVLRSARGQFLKEPNRENWEECQRV